MKVLVTGASGQLGTDIVKVLEYYKVVPLTHTDIDITDFHAVKGACFKHKPDVIVNTAAYVRVDDCETNQDLAFRVNALGARNIAVVAEELGSKLAHISTDYIFGGESGVCSTPYTEFDTPVPLSTYGKSKLAGEEFVRSLCRRHFIIRTSALFGLAGSSGKGGNFIETILRLAQERDELAVVNDQVFSPTYTPDLAIKISQLIRTELYGTYHITNSGTCSWYGFARETLRLASSGTSVLPIPSAEYPQKAKRPTYSVLGHYHLRLLNMDDIRSWQEALAEYMTEKGHNSKQ
ncbi:dTDP-4-dehydrorhamnose reductase [Chloroflexota bacterium]